jgi:uncharacterized delta-60 repeat protein/uncharacterized repeat protein (TIGR01451 family)
MLTVQKNETRRAAGFLRVLFAVAAFCGGSALQSQAQPAPPNDNSTNAQGIIGVSGSVQGTNFQATVQPNETSLVPGFSTNAQSTIWYEWTAPIATTMDFNTRGSTDPDGITLQTTLAVYQLMAPGPAAISNLAVVAGAATTYATNIDDPSGSVTSRVDFQAAEGATYFIQVGSITNTFDNYGQGKTVLNWAPSLTAGGFGFSTPAFLMSSLENWVPDDDPTGSIAPSIYGLAQGSTNARITINRTGGFTGRCEVTLIVGTGLYTNDYFTNYAVTNILVTNYSQYMPAPLPPPFPQPLPNPQYALGFTNIYITNVAWINDFQNYDQDFGGFYYVPVFGDEYTTLTNLGVYTTNGGMTNITIFDGNVETNPVSLANIPLADYLYYPPEFSLFFTNWPCVPQSAGIFAVSNSDTTWTIYETNVICYGLGAAPTVAASHEGYEFVPSTNTYTFDDFQMSQDAYVELYPILNVSPIGMRPSSTPVQDFPTFGPEDEFNPAFSGDPNYIYSGLNPFVNLTLTNLVLDPQENPDILAPTIAETNAIIGIENYYGNPNPLGSNVFFDYYVSLNFERYTYRCNKLTDGNPTTAFVAVQRDERFAPATGQYSLHYTIDSKFPNVTVIDDNLFATVADSEYAVPSAGQADYDFTLPVTKDWTGIEGVVTFVPDAPGPDFIQIPILENGAVEFDEDIELQLFELVSDASANLGAMPPAMPGAIQEARLTINFDNIQNSGVQPGGALDRTYNIDSQAGSQPPENLVPGADATVNAVAIDSNGRAVIGGDFNLYNATSINFVARILTNGFIDDTFVGGLGRGPNNFVRALVIDGSGRIVIGGDFTSVNATNAFYIARLEPTGTLDTSFATGLGFNGSVYALAIDASGNILAGGDFTSFNTTNCNHIARLLPSGGLDPNFLPNSGIGVTNGTDQDVHAVAVDYQGNVILGGNFATVNGTNWSRIARLLTNGTIDPSFNPGFGADGSVLALAVQPDNSIILGGAFQNFNLVGRNSIARLTPGGVLDTGFAPGSGFNDIVYALTLQPDGNILVGGQFTMYNGNRRVALARLFGGQGRQLGEGGWLDTSFMDTAYNQFAGLPNHYYNTNAVNLTNYPASNQRNQVLALGYQPADGNVVIGGNFARVGGGYTRVDIRNRMNLARVIGPATTGPEEGGIGNNPGNLGMTQNPYEAIDTGSYLYVTMDRQNGSLGPLTATLGTNTLAPSSSSATANDFGLFGLGEGLSYSTYPTVYSLEDVGPAVYGWRMSDGEYGFNNNMQPDTTGGADSSLYLVIHNDPSAAAIIYANLNLLNLNANGLMSLGGVPIPLGPALGQYTAGLDIVNGNFPTGTLGFSATNYNVLESAGTVAITLLRTNGDYGEPSVTVVASNGTAVNGSDFLWSSTQEGPFNAYIPVTFSNLFIHDYTSVQSNKFFYLYLTSPTAGATLNPNSSTILPPYATVTIIDDHFQPGYLSFSSPTYSVLKPGLATITVNRTGAALGQVSVWVGTSNGTAINGLNYVGVSNQLMWTNEDITPRTITVQTLQDGTVDGNRTVNLFLYQPYVFGNTNENAALLGPQSNAVLNILETDTNGYISFLTHNFTVFQNSGQALITVTRTGGNIIGSETVNFKTYTLTNVELPYQPAMVGSNYGFTNGQLTFGPGVTSASFTVPVYQNGETSLADRLVGLQLFGGSPTNIAGQFPQMAVLTILDPELHLNSAGSVDTTTQNGVGFNNYVNSLSLQPDGSILAGGVFNYFNGYPFNYVGRLLPDGGYDTSFLFNLTGPNNTVWQVFSQPPSGGQQDGNIMIVGDFTQVNMVNSPRIARLNLNGVLDTSFNPGSGADGTIYAITNMSLPTAGTNLTNVTFATNYVIGGAFANYNGNPAGGVARVLTNGLPDPSFHLGSGATGSNAVVHALAITPDNQLLVGGDFTSFDNQAHHYLVELNLDGTLNTNFAAFDGISSDLNGAVRALAVQPDGRILIGGLFTSVSGGTYNYIARLNADGSTDTNFNVGVGCNNNVQALVLDDQLRILVGGAFTQASGVTRNGLTRLNPDGTVDPSINFGFGANGYVDTIVIQTNEEINVAGSFSSFDNIPENNFVRLFGGANAGDGSIQFSQQSYGVLESATNAFIGIQRLGGTFGSPSVSAVFFTSNNTSVVNEAAPGVNYSPVTNTVTFPLGETFETVEVPIINSQAIGPNLLVSLELTNPPSNSEEIGPQVNSTLIITNANAGVEFSAQGFNESSTAGVVSIPVVRVGNTNSTVSVIVYTGTNGTATPFTNYVPTTNVLTFYPGVTNVDWLITLANSPTTFQTVTVDLEMEDATNAIVASPSSATLFINTTLTGPGYLSFSQTNYTVSEGMSNAVITVVRTNGNYGEVQVTLTTAGGTAIQGVNYSNATTVLTIPNGFNSATDNIPIIQLTNAAPNATVNLTLSNPLGNPPPSLVSPTQAVLTIVNDIAAFSFSSASYFVSEGSGTVTLTILRTGPTNGTATVYYSTYSPPGASETNGYAVPGVDYVPVTTNSALNPLVFPPGETLETIPVTILQTSNVNPVLSFQVLLQNPSPGTQIGAPATATVGIISDVTGFAFATNAYYVGENGSNVVITVNRLNANTESNSVNFSTTSGATNDNAIPGVDYVATNGTLNFPAGQATNSFTVQILNPNLVESNKMFNITLSSPSSNSYVVTPSNTVVTITNVYVGLAFGSPTFTVSECATSAVIPVVRSGLTNITNNVTFGTEDGSGVANENYFPTNGFLEFLPGQTVAYFDVIPINNHIIGPDHTVQLNLTNNFPVPPTVAGVQLLTPSTALLTIEECNGADIVKSGTAFVTGSIMPSTGVIYSNDTVTILMGLRDISGSNADNLVATLVLSNGITSNGIANFVSSNNYGTLIQNGPTVSRPFTFTAIGTNGQNITATLNLRDDQNPTNLNPVSFGFTIGGSTISYTNGNTIFLPENPVPPTIATNSIAPGYGYPSLISVSGIPGLITEVTVTFSNFGHSYPEDVDAVLEAPNGSNSILMSHVGSADGVGYGLNYSPAVPPVTLTFDQTASTHLPLNSRLTTGTYLPTTNVDKMPDLPSIPTNETVPVAPPEPPLRSSYGANLSTFLASSPNGYWSLWAICDQAGDSGYISNGWILSISTGVAVENDSDLEVTLATNTQPTAYNPLTYFVTVTNFGPSTATNVNITDYLPAGVEYLSNNLIGAIVANGALSVTLPSLATNSGTSFEVYVMPTNVGFITNIVTALALEPDPNSNNMITNIALVSPASANVAISLTGGPNPVLVGADVIFTVAVTNNGPSDAGSVTNIVVLPSGFVSDTNVFSPSSGGATNVNGTITWILPNLPTGVEQTLVVGTKATVAGIGLCSASTSYGVYDPLKGNSFASVKIEVDAALLSVVAANQTYQLTWSALATNYSLQGAVNLPPPGENNLWNNIPAPPIINGQYVFTLPGANGYHFFRLSAPLP